MAVAALRGGACSNGHTYATLPAIHCDRRAEHPSWRRDQRIGCDAAGMAGGGSSRGRLHRSQGGDREGGAGVYVAVGPGGNGVGVRPGVGNPEPVGVAVGTGVPVGVGVGVSVGVASGVAEAVGVRVGMGVGVQVGNGVGVGAGGVGNWACARSFPPNIQLPPSAKPRPIRSPPCFHQPPPRIGDPAHLIRSLPLFSIFVRRQGVQRRLHGLEGFYCRILGLGRSGWLDSKGESSRRYGETRLGNNSEAQFPHPLSQDQGEEDGISASPDRNSNVVVFPRLHHASPAWKAKAGRVSIHRGTDPGRT